MRGCHRRRRRAHALAASTDIKAILLDDRPNVALAIFPVGQYSGTITTDLFGEAEESYFDDTEQFMTLQQAAVEKLAAHHAECASWVEVTNAYRIPDWQYDKAEEGETGGAFINLSPSGKVEIREGRRNDPSGDSIVAALVVVPQPEIIRHEMQRHGDEVHDERNEPRLLPVHEEVTDQQVAEPERADMQPEDLGFDGIFPGSFARPSASRNCSN